MATKNSAESRTGLSPEREGMRLPMEIVLHTLQFSTTSDLIRMLEDRTSFRAAPALILRQRFLRVLEEPGVSLFVRFTCPTYCLRILTSRHAV